MGLKEILLGLDDVEPTEASVFQNARLVSIYSPQNEVELALIRSLLEGAGIVYFVHNDHFGSLQVGPQIYLYNRKTIMVREQFEVQARELIKDFLEAAESETALSGSFSYSWLDKLRCFLETFIGGWVVPHKGFKKDFPKKDIIPIIASSTVAAIVLSCVLLSLFWALKQLEIYFKYRFYY